MNALEVPPGFGLRQPSGAFPAPPKKAPEGWRSPRRWRVEARSVRFMARKQVLMEQGAFQ